MQYPRTHEVRLIARAVCTGMGNNTAVATLKSNTNCHSYSTGAQQTCSTPDSSLAQLSDPLTLASMQTTTIVLMHQLEHTADLLAYCFIIIKASIEYGDMPWLDYDAHFCLQAATKSNEPGAHTDAASWTIYFGQRRKVVHSVDDSSHKNIAIDAGRKNAKPMCKPRADPYTTILICRK